MLQHVKGLKIVLNESLRSWLDHRGDGKGAALAFYTLFSMTPILLLPIVIDGYFFGAEAAQGEIIVQVQGQVGPNGAQAIQALLTALVSLSFGQQLKLLSQIRGSL